MFEERNLTMGPAERRVQRGIYFKLGLILIPLFILTGFFLWQDWSQGHYAKVLLTPVFILVAGLGSTKRFRRPRRP